jgi:hypothetical protein
MKTRIVDSWRTTLIGMLLLVAAVVMFSGGWITKGEFLALIPTVAGLLFVPDSILKPNSKPKNKYHENTTV